MERHYPALRLGRAPGTTMVTSRQVLVQACQYLLLRSLRPSDPKMCTLSFSEYDFYNFNTIDDAGNISTTVLVSPTLNYISPDRPINIAVQMDDQDPQTVAFIPSAAPGQLPAEWDGNDGFVANAAVSVVTDWTAPPGAHTLKVIGFFKICMINVDNVR